MKNFPFIVRLAIYVVALGVILSVGSVLVTVALAFVWSLL